MKISTKGRYALRLMLDIAQNQASGPVTLRDASERQDISKKYLEQIALQLSQSGILRASRGHQGGYMLTRAPEDCSVGEILRITEGSTAPVACLEGGKNVCPRCGSCLTLPVWLGLDRVIERYLDSMTLRDILDGNIPKST